MIQRVALDYAAKDPKDPSGLARAQQDVDRYVSAYHQGDFAALVKAIFKHSDDTFTKDMQARIGYFAEDIVSFGLSEPVMKKLYSSFSKFNLPRRMKRKETALDELQLRTFFDDVTLAIRRHIIQNHRIPGENELKSVYEAVRQ